MIRAICAGCGCSLDRLPPHSNLDNSKLMTNLGLPALVCNPCADRLMEEREQPPSANLPYYNWGRFLYIREEGEAPSPKGEDV